VYFENTSPLSPLIYSHCFFTFPSEHYVHVNKPPRKAKKKIYALFINTIIYLCAWLPGRSGLQPL
jgi:hypothetical protein